MFNVEHLLFSSAFAQASVCICSVFVMCLLFVWVCVSAICQMEYKVKREIVHQDGALRSGVEWSGVIVREKECE